MCPVRPGCSTVQPSDLDGITSFSKLAAGGTLGDEIIRLVRVAHRPAVPRSSGPPAHGCCTGPVARGAGLFSPGSPARLPGPTRVSRGQQRVCTDYPGRCLLDLGITNQAESVGPEVIASTSAPVSLLTLCTHPGGRRA